MKGEGHVVDEGEKDKQRGKGEGRGGGRGSEGVIGRRAEGFMYPFFISLSTISLSPSHRDS